MLSKYITNSEIRESVLSSASHRLKRVKNIEKTSTHGITDDCEHPIRMYTYKSQIAKYNDERTCLSILFFRGCSRRMNLFAVVIVT